MAEGVVAQIKAGPGDIIGSVRHTPVTAIVVLLLVLMIVLFVEAYKPGLLTNIPRKILTTIGLKSA